MELHEDQETDVNGALDSKQQEVSKEYAEHQPQEDSATPDRSFTALPEIDSTSIFEMKPSDYNQTFDHEASQPDLQLEVLSSHSNTEMTKEGDAQLIVAPKSEDEGTNTDKINTDITNNESIEIVEKSPEIKCGGIMFGNSKVDHEQPLDHEASQPDHSSNLEALSSHLNMDMTKEGDMQLVIAPKSEVTNSTDKINADTTNNESIANPTENKNKEILFGDSEGDHDQPLNHDASQPHLSSNFEPLSSNSDIEIAKEEDVQPAIAAISEDEAASNTPKINVENIGNEVTESIAKFTVIKDNRVGDNKVELPVIVANINDDKDITKVDHNKMNSMVEQCSGTLKNRNDSEYTKEKEAKAEDHYQDPTKSENSFMSSVKVNSSLNSKESSQEMSRSEKPERETAKSNATDAEIQNMSMKNKDDKIERNIQATTISVPVACLPGDLRNEEEFHSSQPIDISEKEILAAKQNDISEIYDKSSLLSGVVVGAAALAGAAFPSKNLGDVDTIQGTNELKKVDSKNYILQTEVSPLGDIEVLSASKGTSQESSQFHYIKWIMWKGVKTPIVTQNANGPCPLLAIANVLLLKRQIEFVPETGSVSSEKLLELIGNFILENVPKNIGDAAKNYEQNLSDVLAILPKLQSGIDVNVKFTSVSDFEFTPELALFDLVQIKLYHGWVIDQERLEEVKAIGKRSYNQLVEMIISSKCGDKQDCLNAEIAEAFLEQTATQLTYQGLVDLTFTFQEDELAVFFRNNHFSTIYKTNNQMYTLLTDQGFLKDDANIWETLQDIDGSGIFVNSSFMFGGKPLSIFPGKEQEGQDFKIATRLQREAEEIQEACVFSGNESLLTDEQLAYQLQQEEQRRAGTSTSDLPSPSSSTDSQRRPSTTPRRGSANRENKSSCTLL